MTNDLDSLEALCRERLGVEPRELAKRIERNASGELAETLAATEKSERVGAAIVQTLSSKVQVPWRLLASIAALEHTYLEMNKRITRYAVTGYYVHDEVLGPVRQALIDGRAKVLELLDPADRAAVERMVMQS